MTGLVALIQNFHAQSYRRQMRSSDTPWRAVPSPAVPSFPFVDLNCHSFKNHVPTQDSAFAGHSTARASLSVRQLSLCSRCFCGTVEVLADTEEGSFAEEHISWSKCLSSLDTLHSGDRSFYQSRLRNRLRALRSTGTRWLLTYPFMGPAFGDPLPPCLTYSFPHVSNSENPEAEVPDIHSPRPSPALNARVGTALRWRRD